jgi:histidyl-tRNA synthetase
VGFQTLKGMRDLLPEAWPGWDLVLDTARQTAGLYGYRRISTPILEPTSLFARGVGEVTDIVQKEMYTFEDRDGASITMKPEGTAGVVRAYLEHGMFTLPQPVKVYYLAEPTFRHEKPQEGRLRQHHQFGCEALGEMNPQVDVELIALANHFYRGLGLRQLSLQVNSIGDRNCRPAFVAKLREFYEPVRSEICDECRIRLERNPMRLLDCKKQRCQELAQEAPHMIEYLCEDCSNHWHALLEGLEAINLAYTINFSLVRGFDYYTKTVFEFWPAVLGSQSTVGGGGRYDVLAELIGGRPTPAIGFATGIERILKTLDEEHVPLPTHYALQVYVVGAGAAGQRAAFPVAQRLREGGIATGAGTPGKSLKAQLRAANDSGARFAAIVGDSELESGTVTLKDLVEHVENRVPLGDLVAYLSGRLGQAAGAEQVSRSV